MPKKPKDEDKNSKKKKTRRLSGIGAIMIIILIIYLSSFTYWIFNTDIKTSVIQSGTIEESENGDGYIVRDEEIIKSDVTGRFIKEANEGDKVAAGASLATILKDSSVQLLERLSELDNRILQIEKEKSENQAFFSRDLTKIDNEIIDNIRQIALLSNESGLLKVQKYEKDIEELIKKKMEIMGNSGPADANLTAVKNEREEVNNQIKSGTSSIITSRSGIVSYCIDNYEDILNFNTIKNITPETLDKIKVTLGKQNMVRTSINSGEPVAKIIKDFEYYIAVVLDQNKAGKFNENDSIQLRINDINRVIGGVIEYKSNAYDGRVVVAVKVDEALSETTDMRKINVDIINKYYTGLKVPLKSLLDMNTETMTAKILIDEANYAKAYDVKIVGMNDEYAIIDNIDGVQQSGVKLYASYVVNPKNIQEGQMINK